MIVSSADPRCDPDVALLLKQLEDYTGPDYDELPIPRLRDQLNTLMVRQGGELPPVGGIDDCQIDCGGFSLSVRRYAPLEESLSDTAFLYMHGGGWVLGNIATHDALCCHLANDTGIPVFSLEYRLSPEHQFPEPLEDVVIAYSWLLKKYDRIVVGGDSAGGNMAAALCLLARERELPQPAAQLLLYPSMDMAVFETPSFREFSEGYALTMKHMYWFRDQYLGKNDPKNPLISPRYAQDFTGLAPAVMFTLELDPLRDEGIAYADHLERAGVPVARLQAKGMIHGFLPRFALFSKAREYVTEIADALMSLLS